MSLLQELTNALHDRYRVVDEIGRGGMATVYRAEDLHHDRVVAIKVLDPDLSATIGADRFLREIRIATHLSHPNILPVFDSGETGGLLWYAMPFVEGESLRARIDREHQLPVDDAVDIVCQAADALQYAHAQGVVHRDVKPENILLQDGRAVIADFGIARAVNAAESEKLTMTGMSVGTAAYMSPEQFSGMQVDGRADVYSLGCVLYEMLVGQPPYTGANPLAIMARATVEPPPAIRVVRSAVPEAVEAVTMCALQKVPADRIRSMDELQRALRGEAASMDVVRRTLAHTAVSRVPAPLVHATPRWPMFAGVAAALVLFGAIATYAYNSRAGAATSAQVTQAGLPAGPPPSSIAVLYFDDESGDGTLRDIADGLTEALIEQLSDVTALDVISANGVRPMRGRDVAADSVARALHVGTLVRGRVSPAPGGVRIGVDLIEAVSGASIGRRTLVFAAAELQNARDSIAAEVAALLRTQLGNEVRVREQQRAASNAEAWTAVQRAARQRRDADSLIAAAQATAALEALDRADAELERAESLDPQWAEPPVMRAAVALARAQVERANPAALDAAVNAGVAHADRVLAADPRNARAHEVRGQVMFLHAMLRPTAGARELERLLAEAESSLVRAVRLDKQRAAAWATLSSIHYRKPDLQAAALAAMNAYEADAYMANARMVIARLFLVSHDLEQYNEALKWCDTGRRRFPHDRYFVECRMSIMWMRAAEGQAPDSAWLLAEEYVKMTPPAGRAIAEKRSRVLVAGALARGQLKDSARAVLRGARTDPGVDPHREVAGMEAVVRVILGDHDEAVRLIQDYLTVNPTHLKGFATRTGWWWRDLQTHPKFVALLAGAR